MNASYPSNNPSDDPDHEEFLDDPRLTFEQRQVERPDPIAINRMAGIQVERMNPCPVHRTLVHHAWMAFFAAQFAGKSYFRRRALKEAAASIALVSDVGLAERLVREQCASAPWLLLKDYEPIIASFPSLCHLVASSDSEDFDMEAREPVTEPPVKPATRGNTSRAAIAATFIAASCVLVCFLIWGPMPAGMGDSVTYQRHRPATEMHAENWDMQGADIVAGPARRQESPAIPETPTPAKAERRSPDSGRVRPMSIPSLAGNSTADPATVNSTPDDQFEIKPVSSGLQHR